MQRLGCPPHPGRCILSGKNNLITGDTLNKDIRTYKYLYPLTSKAIDFAGNETVHPCFMM